MAYEVFQGYRCDMCGRTIEFGGYDHSVRRDLITQWARERGWTFGKMHKCPWCSGKRKQ